MIPLAVPFLNGREQWYVAEALMANELAAGASVERFERAVCDYTGARHAVAMSSGTAALHVALLLAGVAPGDRVIVPATTFIATVNAVRYCGARPVIVDVDPETWTIDLGQTEDALKAGARTILPVHLYGHPCRLDELRALGVKYHAAVVEDAAEALGALYRGALIGRAGSAALSFNGNKLITTGGGGMLLTDSDRPAQMARHFINQGRLDADALIYSRGYNYRMPNINAAIGLAQMETVEDRLRSKRETAEHYQSALPTAFREQPWARSSYWLPAVMVDDAEATQTRLKGLGIETRRVWRPLHQQPGLSECAGGPMDVACSLYKHGLLLPSSAGITAEERERVIEALR